MDGRGVEQQRVERVEIRSFAAVFDLERRIYRIDRLRLNPAGVPLRAIVYFTAAATCVSLACRLPAVGPLAGRLPWMLRLVAAPACVAAFATILRVDGRPFHRAVLPILRLGRGPRALSGLAPCVPAGARWQPPDLVVLRAGCRTLLTKR